MDVKAVDVFKEMTVDQLKAGLIRANEQLQTYIANPVASRDAGSAVQTVLKLQNVVRAVEAEIRFRERRQDGLTLRFEMKLSPEQKQWLMDNGGAAKVRELIDRARQ